jgi:hypothetical protein
MPVIVHSAFTLSSAMQSNILGFGRNKKSRTILEKLEVYGEIKYEVKQTIKEKKP